MNGAGLGFAAIVVFVLLLIFFFAAMAVAPPTTTLSGAAAASQPIILATIAGSNASLANQTVNQTGVSAAGGTGVISYTVQPGEWLSSIARQYNTTVPAILAVNPQITDSDTLRPGQVIRIPTP